ncbi:MAG: NAD(P)-dependent oxidoreductase [Anaerolineae bacterium]|nr:NAD(P)-dependent oxidoreductase [Thermoflexales bacterium]MDW8408995.1 NAD(P)-dependent oxidoreductase [Anaerolineae bacterium]
MLDAPQSEQQLEEYLTQPTEAVLDAVRALDGDLIILGAGGKIGPSLAVLASRSLRSINLSHRVICVSRFSVPGVADYLRQAGVEVIAADMLAPGVLEALPDVSNVIYLAGMKFGSTGAEPMTWMLNAFLPGLVARRFAHSRIVALSTGNVYPLVPVTSGGATEQTLPSPHGEYAMSCLARERMFQYAALNGGTRVMLIRLNYANDLRYGVLHDIAQRVLAGEPVDLSMGAVNVIWQGDANRVILQCVPLCAAPARVLNLTGPETVSVRWLAERFGELFGRSPVFIGQEHPDALLSNAAQCWRLFGYPRITLMQMIEWTAAWIGRGGRSLGKPTHFETRNGRY